MFTPKANSIQKCTKKTQKRETGHVVWEHFAYVKDISCKRDTSSSYSLTAGLSEQSTVLQNFSRVWTIFHPKTQILISQHPKSFPRVVYRFMYTNRLSKTHHLKLKHHFNIIQQSNKVSPKLLTTTQFASPIHNYEHPMHQFINNTFHNNNNNNI